MALRILGLLVCALGAFTAGGGAVKHPSDLTMRLRGGRVRNNGFETQQAIRTRNTFRDALKAVNASSTMPEEEMKQKIYDEIISGIPLAAEVDQSKLQAMRNIGSSLRRCTP